MAAIATASTVRSLPEPSAALWSALDHAHFRHAKLRAAELPSRFLHVSMQSAAPQSNDSASPADPSVPVQSAVAVGREDVWRVFNAFGEVAGLRMLAPTHTPHAGHNAGVAATAKPHPKAPQRQFAYVAFKLKQHAAHALLALHQKSSPLLPAVQMHVHHAVERADELPTNPDDGATSNGDAASAAASAGPPVPPAGLHVVASFLSAAECEALQAPVAHLTKGDTSYGAALAEEDDRFGLRKPQQMDQSVWGDVLRRVEELTSATLAADGTADVSSTGADSSSTTAAAPSSSSSSSAPSADVAAAAGAASSASATVLSRSNRATLSVLRPGQGLKRGRDAPHLFGPASALLNLGPSHVVLELAHPLRPAKERWGVLMQAGTLALLTGPARFEFEYSVSGKTRDVLPGDVGTAPFLLPTGADPPAGGVNLKRGRSTLAFLRHLRAEPLPAPEGGAGLAMSAGQAKLSAKEKRARREEEEEKKEKKVHSTAMQMPGSENAPASGGASASDVDAETAAARMEQLHVTGVYDSIATHFSNTRHSPWPRIERFVESLPAGFVVADVGCGNGKYMGLNQGISIRGCDASEKLVEICVREKGYDVVTGDLLDIPFPSGHFDAVICIAVLHHISTLARRQRGVRELMRLLKPGGRVLVSAWALEQDAASRRAFPSQDVLVPWAIPRRFVAESPQALQVAQQTSQAQVEAAAAAAAAAAASATVGADAAASSAAPSSSPASSPSPSPSTPALVDPSSGAELVHYQRYCHVYKEGELESLFTSQFDVGTEIAIADHYYDRGNWCVVVQKLKPTKLDLLAAADEKGTVQA